MTEDIVRAIFLLAHIEILGLEKIPNEYWPQTGSYNNVRENSPWWKITTSLGFIKIGWRKHVIYINWENLVQEKVYMTTTGLPGIFDAPKLKITEKDDVTVGEYHCHADTEIKAAQYLRNLHRQLFKGMTCIGFFDYGYQSKGSEGFHV